MCPIYFVQRQEEARILASGACLTPAQLSDAWEVGVAHPERVRLVVVTTIPAPEHPVLREAGAVAGPISPFTPGLRSAMAFACGWIFSATVFSSPTNWSTPRSMSVAGASRLSSGSTCTSA